MTIERMIELLEIEHECMLRGAHDDCDRNCANCELVQDDGDLHEMYTDAIALLQEQEEQIKNRDESLEKAREEIKWLRGMLKEQEAAYQGAEELLRQKTILFDDAIKRLKEQEVQLKTVPEELKLKMWNALYAAEDKFEEKCIGTKEQDIWFLIYRPWLQEGFNLAIKVIADWEGR